tara:strand:- start:107 stop:223 length:117 start_codon:yes stop_codon:yes gene_type:complete
MATSFRNWLVNTNKTKKKIPNSAIYSYFNFDGLGDFNI